MAAFNIDIECGDIESDDTEWVIQYRGVLKMVVWKKLVFQNGGV